MNTTFFKFLCFSTSDAGLVQLNTNEKLSSFLTNKKQKHTARKTTLLLLLSLWQCKIGSTFVQKTEILF